MTINAINSCCLELPQADYVTYTAWIISQTNSRAVVPVGLRSPATVYELPPPEDWKLPAAEAKVLQAARSGR
ncbi:unnamed protein product [Clonostachys rosea f. rosea IK726]|uniref:Uncharacterized protein n=1 Tax=Clonostachys rosea f. rosea IK726 TaxID=1349383 RepID=A0ACA9UT25_BIOOC|nr:unnamed protein product [Clonostachys rosea f. rosea IK726]